MSSSMSVQIGDIVNSTFAIGDNAAVNGQGAVTAGTDEDDGDEG